MPAKVEIKYCRLLTLVITKDVDHPNDKNKRNLTIHC